MGYQILRAFLALNVSVCLIYSVVRVDTKKPRQSFLLYLVGSLCAVAGLLLSTETSWLERAENASFTWALTFAAGAYFGRLWQARQGKKEPEVPEADGESHSPRGGLTAVKDLPSGERKGWRQ